MVITNRTAIFMAMISLLVGTSSSTDAEDICSRRWSSTTVVGNKLYINGGQNLNITSQKWSKFDRIQYIDLSTSWGISSPLLYSSSKPTEVTNVNEACSWSDGVSFFQYGGWQTEKAQESFRLWELDPSTSSWQETSTDSSVNRLASGGYVNAAKIKKSYAFGGFQDQATTSDPWYYGLGKIQGAPGRADLIEFDWETKATRNITYNNQSDRDLTIVDNSLVYVPAGKSGILVPISGRPNLALNGYKNMANFAEINFYDIASSTWYYQSATGSNSRGDIPSSRVESCSIVQSAPDNSSFNIYMFGGSTTNDGTGSYNDVWILSLPSFKWIKVDNNADSTLYIPGERTSHTCQVIGNRQMVVVGGASSSDAQKQCQSLSSVFVFDTSSLSWKSGFDPSEAAYVLPTAITDVIGGDENGNADKDKNRPDAWTNSAAEKIFFSGGDMSTASQNTSSSSSSSSSSPQPSSTSVSGSESSAGPPEPKTSVAPIVGGVVGGLFALSAVAIGLLFMRRRRQKEKIPPTDPEYVPELGTGGELHELGDGAKRKCADAGAYSTSSAENFQSPTERIEMP